jgi:hypothetical protein
VTGRHVGMQRFGKQVRCVQGDPLCWAGCRRQSCMPVKSDCPICRGVHQLQIDSTYVAKLHPMDAPITCASTAEKIPRQRVPSVHRNGYVAAGQQVARFCRPAGGISQLPACEIVCCCCCCCCCCCTRGVVVMLHLLLGTSVVASGQQQQSAPAWRWRAGTRHLAAALKQQKPQLPLVAQQVLCRRCRRVMCNSCSACGMLQVPSSSES